MIPSARRRPARISLTPWRVLRRHMERNPIAAWTGEWIEGQRPYFGHSHGEFRFELEVPPHARGALAELTRELCEWRLAEYLRNRYEQAG